MLFPLSKTAPKTQWLSNPCFPSGASSEAVCYGPDLTITKPSSCVQYKSSMGFWWVCANSLKHDPTLRQFEQKSYFFSPWSGSLKGLHAMFIQRLSPRGVFRSKVRTQNSPWQAILHSDPGQIFCALMSAYEMKMLHMNKHIHFHTRPGFLGPLSWAHASCCFPSQDWVNLGGILGRTRGAVVRKDHWVLGHRGMQDSPEDPEEWRPEAATAVKWVLISLGYGRCHVGSE